MDLRGLNKKEKKTERRNAEMSKAITSHYLPSLSISASISIPTINKHKHNKSIHSVQILKLQL